MGHRVGQRLDRLKAERSAANKSAGKGLVVVKGAIVTDAFARQFPDLKLSSTPNAPLASTIAYVAGFEAGEQVNLVNKELTGRRWFAGKAKVGSQARPEKPLPQRATREAVAEVIAKLKVGRTGLGFWLVTALTNLATLILVMSYAAGLLCSLAGAHLAH